jgi:hypothetical protein
VNHGRQYGMIDVDLCQIQSSEQSGLTNLSLTIYAYSLERWCLYHIQKYFSPLWNALSFTVRTKQLCVFYPALLHQKYHQAHWSQESLITLCQVNCEQNVIFLDILISSLNCERNIKYKLFLQLTLRCCEKAAENWV